MQERYDNGNNYYSDDSSIDITRIAGALLRKLWLVVLAAVIMAVLFYLYAVKTYVPSYTSGATLAFTTTKFVVTTEDGKETGIGTEKKHYGERDVQRYQFLIKSDEMVSRIKNEVKTILQKDYTNSFIENSLYVGTARINNDEITGIFNINVISTDKAFCREAIKVIIDVFPGYLKGFDSTLGIDVIKNPKEPYVNNGDGALQKAFYGAVIGAAAVVGLVFLIEILSDTVKSVSDIRSRTNLKVIGTVPIIDDPKRIRGKKSSQKSLLITDEDTVGFTFIESFKSIRTKIENVAAEKGYKTFVVTSTFEDEGKTTVAVNIACALALKGKSVLVIDCDLRKPSVLEMIGLKEDEKAGLIQIIKNKATYMDSIRFVKHLGIFVLSSGGVSPKSTQFLDADKVRDVLEKAKAEFDYIIIDTPPAHVVSDSLVIAPLAEAMIFTIKKDYAKINDINDTIEEISTVDIDILGTIFTMSNAYVSGRYYSLRWNIYRYRYRRGYYNSYVPGSYARDAEK